MIGDKITKTQYDDLKSKYLSKNRTLHSLYIQANEENNMNKQLFFKVINKIRQEEGLNDYYVNKKQKRRNNIIKNLDKSPNCYNT